VLSARGANQVTTTTAQVTPYIPGTTTAGGRWPVAGTLAVAVTNAGNARGGTMRLYFKR